MRRLEIRGIVKSSSRRSARFIDAFGGRHTFLIVVIGIVAAGCVAPQPATRPAREDGSADIDTGDSRDAAALPPVDPSDSTTAQTHKVVPGDTLFSLAKKYYGDTNQYRRIYYANRNRISNPRNIPVGMKLIIPPPPR